MGSPVTMLVRKHDRIVFLGDSITEQQQLALKGAKGPYHHARAHAAGSAFSARLDNCRPVVSAADLACTLTIVPATAPLKTFKAAP